MTPDAEVIDVIPTPTSPAETVAPPAAAARSVVVNDAWQSTLQPVDCLLRTRNWTCVATGVADDPGVKLPNPALATRTASAVLVTRWFWANADIGSDNVINTTVACLEYTKIPPQPLASCVPVRSRWQFTAQVAKSLATWETAPDADRKFEIVGYVM